MMEEVLFPKVAALYRAVAELIEEGADVNEMKVSDITARAGIGKGTAYDYFKNKEDIISSAMVWQIDRICGQIEKEFEKLDCFTQILRYILDCMDEEIKKRDCFIRYIHILSDNGPISKSLREKIEKREERKCTPVKLLTEMVDIGIRSGEITENLPKSFMCMEIGAKLVVYAMYLETGSHGGFASAPFSESGADCSKEQIHGLICDCLLKEFK